MNLLINDDRVASAAVIQAELIQGARSQKEIMFLQSTFRDFHWLEGHDEDWEQSGLLSFMLRKQGRSINLTDCYIAMLAENHSAMIFSLDKHFRWISRTGRCRLFSAK